jgi:ribosomal-protein-alanine N-acetyltransferase
VIIRPAREQDLAAILEIQSGAPEASHWNPRDYLSHECRVAEEDGAVVGFSVARRVADRDWEVLNLAVAAAFRRRGIGRRLVRDLLDGRGGEFFLEVRESNTAARELYQQSGFRMITKRLQYYANPVETAIVMKLYSC